MIKSFGDKRAEAIFNEDTPKGISRPLAEAALKKLRLVDQAHVLSDLRVPPGNRLEALSGGRKGQHSIRVNQQWRICFVWKDDGVYSVELVDYH